MSAQDDYPAVIRGDCPAPGVHMNEERVDALYRELDALRAILATVQLDLFAPSMPSTPTPPTGE